MRQNLGRLLLLLLLPLLLHAAHRWEVEASKSTLVVGEATLLTYTCHFDDEAYGTSVDMELPQDDPDFSYRVYREKEHMFDGKRHNSFAYLVVPKRSGVLHVRLKALMRKTSKEQVENAVIGRDNVEYYQFATKHDALPEVALHVKASHAKLVGDFSLHVSKSETKLEPFEPLHVTLTLKGEGNLDAFEPFHIDLEGVEVFSEAPKRDYRLSKKGYEGQIVQKFALVSESNFILPAFEVAYYSLKEQRLKRLKTEPHHYDIKMPYTKEELLDIDESESSSPSGSYFYYLLTLLSGIVIGWYLHLLWGSRAKKSHQPKQQKSTKALLMELALDGRYNAIVSKAEKEGWSRDRILKAVKSDEDKEEYSIRRK